MFKYWYIYRIREIHTIVIVGLFNFTKIILLIWHVVKIHITLGCFDSCAVVTLPMLFPSDGQYTLFFNGTNNIKYKVVGANGGDL